MKWLLICLLTFLITPFSAGRYPVSLVSRFLPACRRKKVFWVGGIEGYKTEELEDLYWFSADMPERMQFPRLRQDYRDFEEYCSIAKATQDVEMNQAIRLLDEYFPLPQSWPSCAGRL